MKYIKWKILALSCMVALLPILLGVYLWNYLPDTIAIHFNINNNPDNFASKGFVVFGLPVFMVFLQTVVCVVNDIEAHKHSGRKHPKGLQKWIIPIVSVVLQTVTLGYALGWNIDIRKVCMLLVAAILIITGTCMPQSDYIKNYDIDATRARKINRFAGRITVVMGALFALSIFFTSVVSIVCICLMIPYAIAIKVYTTIVCRKQD